MSYNSFFCRNTYGVTRQAVFNSATLKEMDDVYMKRMLGFKSTHGKTALLLVLFLEET